MSNDVAPTVLLPAFEHTYADELGGLYEPWQGDRLASPETLIANRSLAEELGLDADWIDSAEGAAVLSGASTPAGAVPIAQAYAGHQFGGYSPRLGDGRALLLGELIDVHGVRRDLHLKGSGRTPFSRGGDGKAAVGPMMREYVISEAMHALGIPTTRALAVVATNEDVRRETVLPGAVLARVASSHLRVGTFQFAAATGDTDLLRRLADYAIHRHVPEAADDRRPYLSFFEAVVRRQAELVARWMLVGFIHGVMNTDNTTISGETIDYGPCAFMDRYDPATVFSSIDHGGRYAFGNQPRIMVWNLARLAETLLPLIADDPRDAIEPVTESLNGFVPQHMSAWMAGVRAKLGLVDSDDNDESLITDLYQMLGDDRVDGTSFFRSLSEVLRGRPQQTEAMFAEPTRWRLWADRWRARSPRDPDAMDRVNPVYIPRNHLVEEALSAATEGDLASVHRLVDVLRDPFTAQPGAERWASPAPTDTAPYRTFCGT